MMGIEMKIDADVAFDFLMRYAHPKCEDIRNEYCRATEEQRHIMYEPYEFRQSVYYMLPEELMNEFRKYENEADYGNWIKLWEQLKYPKSQYAALMYINDKCFMNGLYASLNLCDAFRVDKANLILFEWFEKVKKEGADFAGKIREAKQYGDKRTQQDIDNAKQDYEDWKKGLHGLITRHLMEYVKCCGDLALVKWSNNVHDIEPLQGNLIRESQVVAITEMRKCIVDVINAENLDYEATSFDEYFILLAAQTKGEEIDTNRLKGSVDKCLKWLKDEAYKMSCKLSDQLAYKCQTIAYAWSLVSEKYGKENDDVLKRWREWHVHYEGWNKPQDEYDATTFNIILIYIMVLITVMEDHFDDSKQQEDYLLWITNAIMKQYDSCQENSVLADMYLEPLSLVKYVTDKSFPQLQELIYGRIVDGITPIYKMISMVENKKDSLTDNIRQRIIERYDEEQPLWTPIMESRRQQMVIKRQKRFVEDLRRG